MGGVGRELPRARRRPRAPRAGAAHRPALSRPPWLRSAAATGTRARAR
ncbi:MAG: hypothetical protein NVV70_07410 [Cellulomonas sp.]|nr:hypothetical protein [Cellulomonas sp.]